MNVVSFYISQTRFVNALFDSIFEFAPFYSLSSPCTCLSWNQERFNMLENLRILRESRGYTQQQLADLVGVSRKSIQKYETSKYEPDIKTIIRFADVFDVSVDYLVGHQIKGQDPVYPINEKEFILIEKFRRFDAPTKNFVRQLFDKLSL